MKLARLVQLVSAFILAGVGLSVRAGPSVVSQVHAISVHVRDHAAFEALFLLFRNVLQSPLVYGSLSKPGNESERLYAGFSAGNAYLEPCGPYVSDEPFSQDRTARFQGLTFSPATSLGDGTLELARRGISQAGVIGGGSGPLFVYFNDALLTGKLLAVSIWEIQDKKDPVNFGFLSSSLQQSKGGALGVKCIEEVRVGCPRQANLEQWSHFLSPAKHEGDAWSVGNGPVLRMVPSKANQIESIVLKVESLEKARDAAEKSNLPGKVTLDGIELSSSKTLGLRILLKEK